VRTSHKPGRLGTRGRYCVSARQSFATHACFIPQHPPQAQVPSPRWPGSPAVAAVIDIVYACIFSCRCRGSAQARCHVSVHSRRAQQALPVPVPLVSHSGQMNTAARHTVQAAATQPVRQQSVGERRVIASRGENPGTSTVSAPGCGHQLRIQLPPCWRGRVYGWHRNQTNAAPLPDGAGSFILDAGVVRAWPRW